MQVYLLLYMVNDSGSDQLHMTGCFSSVEKAEEIINIFCSPKIKIRYEASRFSITSFVLDAIKLAPSSPS